MQNSLNFRVEGRNRTLQQQVVFTGNLIPLPATNTANSNTLLSPSILNNSRITGTATVNATNQVEINAVPASH
jgi:hypothetical protein